LLPIISKITSFFNRTPKSEYFLVFLIESKFIKVAVWEKIGDKIRILKITREEFSGSLEDLIETSDRAISRASFGIPPENLSKVIFSVPSVWSRDGKIEQNYLTILKNVCVSLSLKPIGFVITSEVIVRALESEDSLKINYLLLNIGESVLNLSNIEHGALIESISSLRSENGAGEDLLEMVKRFKAVSLPNKIIIFDGSEDLGKIKEEIIKAPLTQKEKRFLHFPSVEILEENADISSIVKIVSEQMGVKTKVSPPEKTIQKEIEVPSQKINEEMPTREITISEEEVESLGFFHENENEVEADGFEDKPEILAPEIKKPILIASIALFVIFLGIIIFWFIFGKAEITLNVKTKDFKSQTEIFLTNDEKLKNDKTILGREIQTQVSGKMQITTTGRKKTGEKATGEVAIFNKNTDAAKTFKKGTLISDGNLNYVLDNDVTIASASMKTDAGSETKIFGRSENVKVTAEKFGNEYNTQDSKDWTVDNFAESSFSGHNERAFTGGTTREIQAISDADKKNLQSKLESSLEKSAKLKLTEKIDKEKQEILSDFISKKIQEKQFSGDADDEAKKLDLSMTIQYSSFSYQKSDAKKILDHLLIGKIPQNSFLNQNSIVLKLDDFKKVENGYNLNFTYVARAVPKINVSEMTGKIKGSAVESLGKLIKSNDILSYDVKILPPLPLLSTRIPFRENNIVIKIKY